MFIRPSALELGSFCASKSKGSSSRKLACRGRRSTQALAAWKPGSKLRLWLRSSPKGMGLLIRPSGSGFVFPTFQKT